MTKDSQEFIEKLYQIVNKKEGLIVEWDQQGKGFIVHNLLQFTNQILFPKFNISRLESFARKLNKYGFKRSKIGKNKIRFFHPNFSEDGSLLSKIQKLNKEETLPKHIKLRLLRDQLAKQSISDQDIGSYLKNYTESTDQAHQKYQIVNGNYFLLPVKKSEGILQTQKAREEIYLEPIHHSSETESKNLSGQQQSLEEIPYIN